MLQTQESQNKISERKIIVYRPNADRNRLEQILEKMKIELFVTLFLKPRPEDIQFVSIDRYYKPYLIVNGKYSADYWKRRVYILDVDNETEEVKILKKKLRPETVVGPDEKTRKVIKIEAEESFTYEDRFFIVFDENGREIPLDQVPTAPSEEKPLEILKKFYKNEKTETSNRRMIEMVRANIAQRAPAAQGFKNEDLQIFEEAMIYSPIFEILFRNVKSNEERVVKVNGVTLTPEKEG